MQTRTLLKQNLTYYWRTNLAIVFGVATAVAVLAGALVVGDSVRGSLRDMFLQRLGNTDHVISSANFFREELASEMAAREPFAGAFKDACPLIVFQGMVAHQESGRRAAGVQVYGVDDRFWHFHDRGNLAGQLEDRDVMISDALAQELGSRPGDSLLVSIEKPAAIPVESLHGRKDELGRTVRLTIKGSLPASELGEFSTRPQQAAVHAVFIPLRRLQRDLEQAGRVNTILVSEKGRGGEAQEDANAHAALLERLLGETYKLADAGIKLRTFGDRGILSLETESAIVTDALAETAEAASPVRAQPILTYLANSIGSAGRIIPYSLVTGVPDEVFDSLRRGPASGAVGGVSGGPATEGRAPAGLSGPPPLVLNEWAAANLNVKPGDPITLEYYMWLPEGRIETRTAEFQLAGVTPIAGFAADRDIVPEYPGITGSESLSDWDPPFPMDLSLVRPVDEDYWDTYRTTPKAYIPVEAAQRLWGSRFGKLTSLRFPAGPGNAETFYASYEAALRGRLDPVAAGFVVFPVRSEGLRAARGATDFGEYFVYFSFFIMVSALLLAALFFKLGVEQRLREIGLLRAIGFPAVKIRNLFLAEGLMLSALGSLLGCAGALLYGWLVMLGLRTWWVDAVGTRLLDLHVSAVSLAIGAIGGVLAALLCIAWTLRSLGPASPRNLLAGVATASAGGKKVAGAKPSFLSSRNAAIGFALLGFVFLAGSLAGLIGQSAGFFGAGTLLLIALLCYHSARLRAHRRGLLQGTGVWALSRLGFRNTTYRPGRSVLCIALIASATFIIVAVDAFRRDNRDASLEKNSGNGGYPLLAASNIPLVHDPNAREGREELNLFSHGEAALEGVRFDRFRVRPGDDASCLNLYQPRNPRILAPTDAFVGGGRFAFQGSLAETAEEKANPWLLLNKTLPDGAVPVIADANSMTYVLHRKLGEEVEISRGADSAIRLRIVGALRDSIFQGELLMSEGNFVHLFPEQEGYRFFLIETPAAREAEVTKVLEESLSDFGFDVVSTTERLAAFHRVENTYLSTFQTLGGLGLLLGTLGLATVLLRNVLERRKELALLRAVGYKPGHFTVMALAENAWLLLLGLLTGAACAALAIAPAFLARGGQLPTMSLFLLLLAVPVAGLAASLLATWAALRSPLLSALRAE